MKKVLLSFLFLAFFVGMQPVQAQRTCASHEHLLQQLSQHPEMAQTRKQIETFTKQFAKAQKNTANKTTTVIYNIPVVVHVLYNTSTQNISDAQIQSQIAVLNADYQKLNADASLIPSVFSGLVADCQIQFCLAQRNPSGAATNGIVRKSTTMTSYSADNDNAKHTSTGGDDAWPAAQYLNLWVVPQITSGGQPGILGYAQFPGGAAATDGVVIGYNYFGNIGVVSSPYNKGRTATHEIGHWLNLNHIWGDDGGACTGTDNVGDTPNQGSENYGCPTFPHVSCSNGPNGDLFMNYMDYTDDACMYMFSTGQKTRMQSVLAPGGARASLASSLGCVAPTTTGCGTVAGLTSTNITTTGATLGWSTVTGATSYNLQWKANSSTAWTTVSNLTTNSYSLSGLTSATAYNFQVQAVCASGTGTYSTATNFTTATAATCAVPTGSVAASISSTGATLNWTAVTGAIGYNLQWKTNASTSWTTVSNLTTNTYSLTGLTASTAYNFKVMTICSSSSSSAYATAVNFTTTAAPVCNIPTGLAASAITTTGATLGWTAVTGAIGYNLQWKTNAATTWTTVSNLTTNTYSLTGLTASTAYNFKVMTICSSSSSSAYATAVNFTTLTPVCNVPTGLAASAVTLSGATLSWTAVSGATSYTLQWKSNSATAWTTVSNLTTPTYNLTGLAAGTTYNFKVMTVCSSTNTSAYATAVNFTTASCNEPTGLSSSAITTTTATVSWTAIPGALSYKLQYRKTSVTAWTTVSTITTTSYALTGLTIGTAYTFQVATNCSSAATSVYSTTATFTTVAACVDNYETNNTIATASTIPVNTAIVAKIGTATDKDYFKFSNTTAAPNIKLTLTNLPADFDLKLYQPNGTTLIATSQNLNTANESIVFNTTAIGTYYAYVYGYSSAFDNVNCYSLTAQIGASTFRTAMPEINQKINEEGSLVFYPNPAKSEVYFDYFATASQDVSLHIYDQSGRLVQQTQIHFDEGANQPKFDVSNLPTGFYIARLVTAQGSIASKLLIRK